MITRPLDLASKLRPRPRNFDILFLVNGGLIVLFFMIFGSRFILSPAMRVDGEDPVIPDRHGAASYAGSTATVTVNASKQIFTPMGMVTEERLRRWLADEGRKTPGGRLLLIVDARVPMDLTAKISDAAKQAGFAVYVAVQPAAAEPPASVP